MKYVYIENESSYIRTDLVSYINIVNEDDVDVFRVVIHTYSTDKVEFLYGAYETREEAMNALDECMKLING